MTITRLHSKDLLGMRQLTEEEIYLILRTAEQMKSILSANTKKTAHLQGKSIINLFLENSTRTRMSFELAEKYLGAVAANISGSGSSVRKGENLYDTARTLQQMAVDIIVMRHPQSGAPHFLSERLSAGIVNGGDGMNEHPTQALLDMLTMAEFKGGIDNLKNLDVAIIGDAMHSRVMRSNLWGLHKLGAKVRVFGPPTMMPLHLDETPAIVCKDIREAVEDVDVVMGLRVQLERQNSMLFPSVSEYAHFFGINQNVLDLAKPDAIVMHPGPCNRGVEMESVIHEHERSVIHEQVTNGVAVRMAVLYLLTAKRNFDRQQTLEGDKS